MRGNTQRKGRKKVIKIYRKAATVAAEQFDESEEMIQKYGIQAELINLSDGDPNIPVDKQWMVAFQYTLMTSDRMVSLEPGDWIATGVEGEHWPIADEIFKKTYAELPVIPSYVAKYMESCKKAGETLFSAIFNAEYMVEDYTDYPGPTLRYISRHCETFARAWLDGYQIEEEN